MKKILPIIFMLFLFLSCYLVYTYNKKSIIKITSIGDYLTNNPYLKKINNIEYNDTFIKNEYEINDIIHILKYNEEIIKDNKEMSIHNILKTSDILIISIGSNNLSVIINNNIKNPYNKINELINQYKILLEKINKYTYKKVYILGYTTNSSKYNDLYVYTNYKLEKLVNEYNYNFINTDKILNHNPIYYEKESINKPNNKGYYEIFKIIVENIKKN